MIFAASISDVLSGASLVMAVLAAVFALWQPEINKALDAEVKPDKENRVPEKKLVCQMKWTRVLPLLLVTMLAALLLVERSMWIVRHALSCTTGCARTGECYFDEAAGLLLLTETLLLILALAMGMQLKALNDKRDDLEK